MKMKKLLGSLLAVVGLCIAITTVFVAFGNLETPSVLVTQDEAARVRITAMMDAFCRGDYTAAQTMLQGKTDLGLDREPADEVGKVVWEAFCSSMTYRLVGDCYASDQGLAQDIVITTMDIDAVMDYVEANSKIVFEQRVNDFISSGGDRDELYDEENKYRTEFVMAVVCDVAREAVANNTATCQSAVTLHLVWEDGQWFIEPSEALVEAISGGVSG